MPADYNHHQPWPPKADTSKLVSLLLKALIMTMITSLFFLLIGLASFVFLPLILISLHRRRRSGTATDFSVDIKRLPQFRYLEHQQCCECVICIDGFRKGQWCRRLVCGHVFHTNCVDTWLVRVAACPTCRTPILFPSI